MKSNISKIVAAPGYQVLLEIGGSKIVVTSFVAVDLTEMFSEEAIEKCSGIAASLHAGYLVEYTDQVLPSDPNAQHIAELRYAAAQHIQTNYSQKGSVLNGNTQIVTDPTAMTEEFKQNLLDQVEKSKAEITATNNSFLSGTSDAYADVDRDPVERKNPLNNDELVMKVSMDIPADKFIAKQRADAVRLDEMRKESPLPTEGTSPVAERSNYNDDEN